MSPQSPLVTRSASKSRTPISSLLNQQNSEDFRGSAVNMPGFPISTSYGHWTLRQSPNMFSVPDVTVSGRDSCGGAALDITLDISTHGFFDAGFVSFVLPLRTRSPIRTLDCADFLLFSISVQSIPWIRMAYSPELLCCSSPVGPYSCSHPLRP